MKLKYIISIILFVVLAFATYIVVAIKKLDFDFDLKKYTPVRINATEGGVINILLDIVIKNPLFFGINIGALYYEVYYKNHILGKSADTAGFKIKPKGDTPISQSVDIHIDKRTIEVVSNYALKIPTDFVAKVYVKIFGLNIKLTNLKFTY